MRWSYPDAVVGVCETHSVSDPTRTKAEQLVLPTALITHNASDFGPSAESTMSCRDRASTTVLASALPCSLPCLLP